MAETDIQVLYGSRGGVRRTDGVCGIIRFGHRPLGGVDGTLNIRHQVLYAGVGTGAGSRDRDCTSDFPTDFIQPQLQFDVAGQSTIGSGDKAVRLDFLSEFRCQQRDFSGAIDANLAAGPPGADLC